MKCALLISAIIFEIVAQYSKGKAIQTQNQPTSMRLMHSHDDNNPHLVMGYAGGLLEIVEVKSELVIERISVLVSQITSIKVDHNHRIVLVGDKRSVALLDGQYQVVAIQNSPNLFDDIIITSNQQSQLLIALKYHDKVIEMRHINKKIEEQSRYTFRAELAQYSPLHHFLYVVRNNGTEFCIYKTSNQEVSNQIKYQPFIKRKYSFQIIQMIVDHKNVHPQRINDLLLVTDDGAIYYTRIGTILTYLPYSIFAENRLQAIDFCQELLIAIVYCSPSGQHFLTLIQKDTLKQSKNIALSDIFGVIKEISSIDCSCNMIAMMTTQRKILILQGYDVFEIKELFTVSSLRIIGIALIVLSCVMERNYDRQGLLSKSLENQYEIKEIDQAHQLTKSQQRRSGLHKGKANKKIS